MSPATPPSPSADGSRAADRALGRRLAERLEQLPATAATRLRPRLPALVGSDASLLAPLHDLLGRPGFQRLLASEGERQQGLRRQALAQELRQTYSNAMATRLDGVLDGLLEALAEESMATPPQRHWLGLVALTAAITLGSGVLFAAVRSNLLCPSLGLCLPGSGRETGAPIDEVLRQADDNAEALANATDLESFTAALERLDTSLLDLVSRRLSPRQEEQHERLQRRADAAHRRLREEQRAQRSLEEATALIEQLERNPTAGPQRLDALAEAQARLDAVPSDSFSHPAAKELEGKLDAVRESPAAPTPQTTPAEPASPGPAPAPSETAPSESAPPAPVLPAPQAPRPAPSQPSTPPPPPPAPPLPPAATPDDPPPP